MRTTSHLAEQLPENTRVIYWTRPVYTNDGNIDKDQMIDFLISQVPDNHLNDTITNVWNPGEEFEVHTRDQENKDTIIVRCKLEINNDPGCPGIVCTLCGSCDTITPKIPSRAEFIARLLSGDKH